MDDDGVNDGVVALLTVLSGDEPCGSGGEGSCGDVSAYREREGGGEGMRGGSAGKVVKVGRRGRGSGVTLVGGAVSVENHRGAGDRHVRSGMIRHWEEKQRGEGREKEEKR